MCVPEEDEDDLDVEEHVSRDIIAYPDVQVEEIKEVITPRMFDQKEGGLFGPDIERSLSCLKLDSRPYLEPDEEVPSQFLLTETPMFTQTYLDNTEE